MLTCIHIHTYKYFTLCNNIQVSFSLFFFYNLSSMLCLLSIKKLSRIDSFTWKFFHIANGKRHCCVVFVAFLKIYLNYEIWKLSKEIANKFKVLKILKLRINMIYCNLFSFCGSEWVCVLCVLVERICIWGFLVSDLKTNWMCCKYSRPCGWFLTFYLHIFSHYIIIYV